MSERALQELEDLGREKLEKALKGVEDLLERERSVLESLARELLAKRDLSRAEIEAVVGEASNVAAADWALAARENHGRG